MKRGREESEGLERWGEQQEEDRKGKQGKIGKGRIEIEERERGNEKEKRIDLGNGSELIYKPRLLSYGEAWDWFHYLDKEIPWTRPTLRVFGRACLQPRDTAYVASDGLPNLVYSGYQPRTYSWTQFPRLNQLLNMVSTATGTNFNSLLLNRYKGGNDYVGWHSDDEAIYGPTPVIASLSLGCDREFYLKNKKDSKQQQHRMMLKHGSLLVMKGNTQRDWVHSVPKRTKLDSNAVRINLTFRLVLSSC